MKIRCKYWLHFFWNANIQKESPGRALQWDALKVSQNFRRNVLLGNLITLAHNRKHHKTKTFPNIFPYIFTRFPLAGNCIFKVSNKNIVYVNMGVVPLILNLLIEHRSKQFIVNFSTYFPDVRNKLHSSQMHVQNYD